MSRARRASRWALSAAFFAVVVWLLQGRLRALDPGEIAAALRELSPARVAVAFAVTAAAYAVVATYDRLASRYAGVRLPAARGFAIPFVSYAVNFNLGAIVGGLGFRYRLYSRENVDAQRIAAIAGFSIVTNWCGCLSVLGAMLVIDPSVLRAGWGASPVTTRLLGALAFAPVAAYLAAAAVRRAPIRIRGVDHPLPRPPVALAQVALASGFWLLVPLVLYALRPPGAAIRYPELAVAYALAALGGLVIRVPAGLGVIEGVFLEVFRGAVAPAAVLAMLIAWRAVFLLAPLSVAAVVLAVLEYRTRGATQRAARHRPRATA
jgi:uncharacterized membrane protein YbhN (UPF0104 family)